MVSIWVCRDQEGFVYLCFAGVQQLEVRHYCRIFTSDCAFVWAENGGVAAEDFWSVKEMKNFLKTNYDLSFPTGYDQFLPIIQAAGDECDAEMLDRFGLAEFKTDIEERMADVAQFSADVEA